MKPEADQILGATAAQLMTQIAPLLPASYSQSTAGVMGIVLGFCAQEFERAADIRVTENAEMRKLFAELAPLVRDAGLRERLTQAAGGKEASLKISDLNAANAQLRYLLIALQAHMEDGGPRESLAKIWVVLSAGADRRLLKLPSA